MTEELQIHVSQNAGSTEMLEVCVPHQEDCYVDY